MNVTSKLILIESFNDMTLHSKLCKDVSFYNISAVSSSPFFLSHIKYDNPRVTGGEGSCASDFTQNNYEA